MKINIRQYSAPLCLIIFIGLATGVLDFFTPLMGDDLSKWHYMGGDRDSFPDRQAISFLAAQYLGTNGRVFDALGPLITNLLPRPLSSALMGFMAAFFFYMLCLAGGVLKRGYSTLACGVVLAGVALLPWYDSMFNRVCQFNYVWGVAFSLLFIHEWFREGSPERAARIWLFLLGGLSGCFHEQIGVTLTFVFGMYLILTRCRDWHWIPFAGLVLGTLVTLATPAIWTRNSEFIADSSRAEMLLSTLPLVIVMLLVSGVVLIRHSRLSDVVKSRPYVVCLSVAVVSSVIALYSTIPGRTGWLAESCSIVALAMVCRESKVRISRGFSAVLTALVFLLIVCHYGLSIISQQKMYKEYQEAIEMYRHSEDGIVRMDYTSRLDVSPLTLYRVKGLPDGDDTYLLQVFEQVYGDGKPLLLIAPDFEVHDSLPGEVEVMSNFIGDTIYVSREENPRKIYRKFSEGGAEFVLSEPFIVDPNDKWHPVK